MSKIEDLISKLCPNGIEWKTIGDISTIVTKQTGFDYSATIKPSLVRDKSEENYPYIQTRDFSGHKFNYDTEFYIPKDIAKNFPKIILDSKCILVSIVGSIGNVGLFSGEKTCFLGGAICVIKLKEDVNIDFIYYCLESNIGQKQLVKKTKGSGQATVTIEDIRNFKIPLPPLAVQREIVHVLDEFTLLSQELAAELAARKAQYEFYRDKLLTFDDIAGGGTT